MKQRLADSETARISLQEQLDKCRTIYEGEKHVLELQLQVFQEDYNAERKEKEQLRSALNSRQTELELLRRQV